MAQSSGCERFQVGTREWTDCVHDQATGGGLMPWIVVIPLGVMVVGMMIGFARQFSAAGQERARAHGAAGTAGSWLIFVAFVELAIGVGSAIGAGRAAGEGGGYAIAATVLLGVGVLLLVAGVWLKLRGRRRARIYHSGVPGEAVIRAVHETGTMVNNKPVYAFDLDVSGQSFAPVSTRHREVVPFWFAGRVGPDARVPVKVDPSNPTRVIFDWERFRSEVPSETAAATPTSPDAETLAHAMQTARDMARTQPRWHVGKVIGLVIVVFVVVVVGGALWFVSTIFGEVSEVTRGVTDQVAGVLDETERALEEGAGGRGGDTAATMVEVSRAADGREPVSFSVTLPVAWNDLTASEPERQGGVLVDLVVKPQTPSDARIVVTRSVRYLQRPAAAGADVDTVRRAIEQELGDALVRSRSVRLAGEKALSLEIAAGADGLRSRQVAVMRGGQLLFVHVSAPRSEWRSTLEVFDRILDSWRWETVSA